MLFTSQLQFNICTSCTKKNGDILCKVNSMLLNGSYLPVLFEIETVLDLTKTKILISSVHVGIVYEQFRKFQTTFIKVYSL